MTADGYRAGQGFHPGSMAMAAGLSVAAVAAIALSAPVMEAIKRPEPIVLRFLPEPPPPPENLKPEPQPRRTHHTPMPQRQPITMPDPKVPTTSSGPAIDMTRDPAPMPTNPGGGTGTLAGDGGGGGVVLPRPPVIVNPVIDPRYASNFQPSYPSEEQRAGRQGRVTVRVLVGADGRVHQVERLDATSDAFFAATERQALKAWRFKPATRDGAPFETWRTMTVTFVLND